MNLMSSDLELSALLPRLVEAARTLVGAQHGALGVLDPTGAFLTEFITSGTGGTGGTPPEFGALAPGEGVLGALVEDPNSVRLLALGRHFLVVPLSVRGEAFGNLYLRDKEGQADFTAADEELLHSLAASAGIAIDNARLRARAGELSLVADRERIGRDLHDKVISRLFATGLAMHATSRLAERPELVHRIERHIEEIDSTIREIRTAIFDLATPNRTTPSLRRDVLESSTRSARVLGFEPTVHFEGPIDTLVPDAVGAHLLAVMREALANVARHAAATRVDVHVTVRRDRALVLEVLDNGNGRLPRAQTHPTALQPTRLGGNGLRNITRRAQELGGSARVAPRPEGGTKVEWIVPVGEQQAPAGNTWRDRPGGLQALG